MISPAYHMELLDKTHDRAAFHCGEEALDRYLREQAGQDMKRHCSTVVVAASPGSKSVLGYYTVSAATLGLNELPEKERKRLPRYNAIPAVLLGRLAVDEQEKGRGLGSLLLADAVSRACRGEIAWAVFIVKAKHARAAAFYRHFGFAQFASEPLLLWSARNTLSDIVG